MNVENMSDSQFTAWKKRQEEKILRMRQESEEFRRESAKFRRESEEFQRESAKLRRESDKKLAVLSAKTDKSLAELAKAVEESTKAVEESAKSVGELSQSVEESAKSVGELSESSKKTNAKLDKVADQLGGWTNNANECLEDEFAEAVEESMQIGGIRLDEVRKQAGGKYEYDLVGVNGDAVIVGEIKRKLLPGDVRRFAENRLPYFSADCPLLAGKRKIFGMVAGETIVADAKAEAKKRGFFILRLKNRKLLVENAENARAIN
ncbi:MAG: hypothetical protein HAW59_02000 [Betaproteobacteria bacterium]|nr:hypothetical protein [Betaproteobacteria bacterium]